VLVAGGSDLMPRIKRRLVKPKLLVDLSSLHELDYVTRKDNRIAIGALTTVSELAQSSVLSDRYEAFRQVAARYGGPAIRNLATIGGNVVAAASSEDLIPVLLTLNAQVTTKSANAQRTMPVREFIVGKRKTALAPEELLTEVSFPELSDSSWCTFEKVGRRNSLIIALVSVALYLDLDSRTRKISEIRVALNRVRGKIPERATTVENTLRGMILNDDTIKDGLRVLGSELSLTADYRASAEYRVEAAKACFEKAIRHCAERIAAQRGNHV
jgi:CO/xanthine dehydrogenase FAD-binding subunit